MDMKKPFLLAPCGSPEALMAAVAAGADECYFGGNSNNARVGAKGFTEEEFRSSLELLRLHGVRSNITLNTLLFDRELKSALAFAENACKWGADAFIVQDLGLARQLKEAIPEVELHASTQCACHDLDGAKRLAALGFSRIVLARELSFEDIKKITDYGKKSGTFETETFIHGALCVCHSGMCLMSSVIGGRSGNRGLCAQPCRMCGGTVNARGEKVSGIYPLSLRDLTLSRHVTELLSAGTASLKIEGRMKSPEYVYAVTKIWRDLIDNQANASQAEYDRLSEIFSRGGFTDGYFTKKYLSDNRKMYGYRSDSDKEKSAGADVRVPEPEKLPISIEVRIKRGGVPTAVFERNGRRAEYSLPSPVKEAERAPLTEESLLKNIVKLGTTPFVAGNVKIDLDDGLFMAASEVNALRRGAAQALTELLLRRDISPSHPPLAASDDTASCREDGGSFPKRRSVPEKVRLRFITDDPAFRCDTESYGEDVESICLPLRLFRDGGKIQKPLYPFGVRLPRVIFEDERDTIGAALQNARAQGASYALISNIGHVDLAKEAQLPLYGGIGLNITNSEAVKVYTALGFESLAVSAELNCAQVRDLSVPEGVSTAMVCEGRLPLMILESCIFRGHSGCGNADSHAVFCGEYIDRIGKRFPVYPEPRFASSPFPCRNVILNSESLKLYRKKDELAKSRADILEIIAISD